MSARTATKRPPAALKSQLKLVGRLKTTGTGEILFDGDTLYTGAYYGRDVHAVDVSAPASPKLLWTQTFKNQVFGLARRDRILYVAEHNRALNVLDLSDPRKPDYFDCVVLFGREVQTLRLLGDTLLAACDEDGLAVFDVSEPRRPRLREFALAGKHDVESIDVGDGLIYVAHAEGGLAVCALEGGRIVERGRVPVGRGARAERVVVAGPRVYAFAGARVAIVDRRTGKALYAGPSQISLPHHVAAVREGGVCFHSHYSCSLFDGKAGPARLLFKQYETRKGARYVEVPEGGELKVESGCMETVTWFARRGRHVFAAQEKELVAYAIPRGSVFETLEETTS